MVIWLDQNVNRFAIDSYTEIHSRSDECEGQCSALLCSALLCSAVSLFPFLRLWVLSFKSHGTIVNFRFSLLSSLYPRQRVTSHEYCEKEDHSHERTQ